MPVFEENTNFQLPGLGSKEKDTPGSFREGTPFNKVSGPETEVSQELTDIKDAQKNVEVSNAAASMAQVRANKNKADLNKKLEDADAPKMGATMEFEEKPLTAEFFKDMDPKEVVKHIPDRPLWGPGSGDSTGPGNPHIEKALLGMIKGVKKYGPKVLSALSTPGLGIGKAIRDRIKGE